MEGNNRSGLRELQIAQGVVTLRWAAIPILLGFSVLSTKLMGMIFAVEPVYILSCLLAVVNIYFTIHISMLSRQLALRHGTAGLRRFLVRSLTHFTGHLRGGGPRALGELPGITIRIMTVFYLMVLESLKGLRFNVLSLENVMHSQVIVDILAIVLFVRFTGSAESPLGLLLAVPVIVASARALMQRTLPYRQFRKAARKIAVGAHESLTGLARHASGIGYEPVSVVQAPGQLSRRGGLLDIYPPQAVQPYRLEFFGDEVDTIRTFDPATQRSTGRAEGFWLTPMREA